MEYYNSFTMVEQEYEQVDEDQVIGFEEAGRSWLPSHVLLGPHEQKPSQLNKQSAHRRPHHDYHKQYYHHQHRRSKISLADQYSTILQHNFNKYHQHRPRFPISNRVSSAGPGMQAVFLDSGRRTSSCGTGFFLPQRAGNTTFQPNKKSAYSPVLLPSRVVQALNLNVHELGSQLAPRRDSNILLNSKNGARDDIDDVVALDQTSSSVNSTLCSVASQTRSSSPEIFLPKEWTY